MCAKQEDTRGRRFPGTNILRLKGLWRGAKRLRKKWQNDIDGVECAGVGEKRESAGEMERERQRKAEGNREGRGAVGVSALGGQGRQ